MGFSRTEPALPSSPHLVGSPCGLPVLAAATGRSAKLAPVVSGMQWKARDPVLHHIGPTLGRRPSTRRGAQMPPVRGGVDRRWMTCARPGPR